MDVDATAQREIEALNRQLKNRERQQGRELEQIRDDYHEKVRDLKQDQSDALASLRERSARTNDALRESFDDRVNDNTDYYERKLADERSENYDRLGRLSQDARRELEQERREMRQRIDEAPDSNRSNDETTRADEQRAADAMRRSAEKDVREMRDYVDKKLDEQKTLHAAELARVAEAARDSIDKNTRYTSDLMQREKLGTDLKYSKLAHDGQVERDQMQRAHKERENQLIDEKSRLSGAQGKNELSDAETYRNRSSEALQRVIADNHALNAKKDREHADRLIQAEHDHQRRAHDARAQFNQALDLERADSRATHERSDFKGALAERRRRHEEGLRDDAARRGAHLAQEDLKTAYAESLRDIDSKRQRELNDAVNDLKLKMTKNDAQTSADRASIRQETSRQTGEAYLKGQREKQALMKTYQDSQEALNDLRKRQLEDQRRALGEEVIDVRAKAERAVATNSLENQTKLYMMQQSMQNRTRELEEQRKMDLEFAKGTYDDRFKRLTDSYHRAITKQQSGFDESSSALRQEGVIQRHRLRDDAEHAMRLQQIDLQTKNRILMMASESRLTEIKDRHEAELEKLKTENEKAVRDVLKKTKETLEQERALRGRELAEKDRQTAQRLRLQEEQFKSEIERLKRSHEFSLKKS